MMWVGCRGWLSGALLVLALALGCDRGPIAPAPRQQIVVLGDAAGIDPGSRRIFLEGSGPTGDRVVEVAQDTSFPGPLASFDDMAAAYSDGLRVTASVTGVEVERREYLLVSGEGPYVGPRSTHARQLRVWRGSISSAFLGGL